MKIAVCLSGQPRYLDLGFKQIQDNIITKYDNIDFFIHTWWDESYRGKKFDFSPHAQNRTGTWDPETITKIYKYYKPKKILYEPHIAFDTSIYNGAQFYEASPQIIMSMQYSINKANEIKSKYEEENNFRYDIVIRARFDITFSLFNIDLLNIDRNKIYLSGVGTHDNSRYNNTDDLPAILLNDRLTYFNDQFAISNSENMDYYCSLYNKAKIYWDKYGATPMGERGLTFHLLFGQKIIHVFTNNELINSIIKI